MKNLSTSECNSYFIALIVMCIVGCTAMPIHAVAQALHLQSAYDTSGPKDIELWPHSGEIISDATARSKKLSIDGAVWSDGRDTYKTEIDKTPLYITANSYLVLTQADRAAVTETSRKAYPGFCAFYIYNQALKFESSYQVRVGDGHASTNCNGIDGVSGVALHGQPALLAVVTYFYTDTPAASSAGAIGSDWYTTTVLLSVVKNPDGKWVFTQDTRCFALTNQIKTLAQAKGHLATCH